MGFRPGWEWVVIALLVLVIFGYKRLPDAARGLGRSLRIFKSEVNELGEDGKRRTGRTTAEQAAPLSPADTPGDQTSTEQPPARPADAPRNDG